MLPASANANFFMTSALDLLSLIENHNDLHRMGGYTQNCIAINHPYSAGFSIEQVFLALCRESKIGSNISFSLIEKQVAVYPVLDHMPNP